MLTSRLDYLEAQLGAINGSAPPAEKAAVMAENTAAEVEDVRVAHMMLESFCRKEVARLSGEVAAAAAAAAAAASASASASAPKLSQPTVRSQNAPKSPAAAAAAQAQTSIGVRGLRSLRSQSRDRDGAASATAAAAADAVKSPARRTQFVPDGSMVRARSNRRRQGAVASSLPPARTASGRGR